MQNLKYIFYKYKNHIKNKFDYTIDFNEFIEILKENYFFQSNSRDNYYFLNIINDCDVSIEMVEKAIEEVI